MISLHNFFKINKISTIFNGDSLKNINFWHIDTDLHLFKIHCRLSETILYVIDCKDVLDLDCNRATGFSHGVYMFPNMSASV